MLKIPKRPKKLYFKTKKKIKFIKKNSELKIEIPVEIALEIEAIAICISKKCSTKFEFILWNLCKRSAALIICFNGSLKIGIG